jgi:hypothetical protein
MQDTLQVSGRLSEETLPERARDGLLSAFRAWKRS